MTDLKQALTHSSMKGEPNNEKLELLGDAVLRLVTTEWLFEQYPKDSEGDTAKKLSAIVSTPFMAERFRDIGYTLRCRCAVNAKVQCDALEAVIAAHYRDSGYAGAKAFVVQSILDYWHGELRDYKTELQELYPRANIDYVIWSEGNWHNCKLYIDRVQRGLGKGRSKKEAGQAAAKHALGK